MFDICVTGQYGVAHYPGAGKSLGVQIMNPVLSVFIVKNFLGSKKNDYVNGDLWSVHTQGKGTDAHVHTKTLKVNKLFFHSKGKNAEIC